MAVLTLPRQGYAQFEVPDGTCPISAGSHIAGAADPVVNGPNTLTDLIILVAVIVVIGLWWWTVVDAGPSLARFCRDIPGGNFPATSPGISWVAVDTR